MNQSIPQHAARVFIVDDSSFFRYQLGARLSRRGWTVVQSVGSGEEALALVPTLGPDLVMMDVVMPGIGGIEAVRALRQKWSGPIMMMSAYSAAKATFEALEAGANDFIAKPSREQSLETMVNEIIDRFSGLVGHKASPVLSPSRQIGRDELRTTGFRALVIGASTGGPRALATLMDGLTAAPTIPIFIVQHMPGGFTQSFARRLTDHLGHPVEESPPDGRAISLQKGLVVLATGGKHLRISSRQCWSESGERIHGVIPCVDVTLFDAVEVFGRDLGVVILSGMGEDGAQGSAEAHARGATVIAEAEETALVWGMPRAVAESGSANAVWPLERIGLWLNQVVAHGS